MCGVVSIVYRDENSNIGREAAALLKRLEYRGYDSTGASFIDRDRNIALVKKVGSPTKVVKELGIEGFSGVRFIGQVRWATYGAVTDANSQPHHVKCAIEMVGAHNGNISNTDTLRKELAAAGHRVVSDNDGEIVVHLVEDQYAADRRAPLAAITEMNRAWAASGLSGRPADDTLLLVHAVRRADSRAEGSYAACVADPAGSGVVAVKSGSSLYAGVGSDGAGSFVVVSSDLTSVLSKTRYLIPLAEGEGLWFGHENWLVFTLSGETVFSKPRLKRSRLNVLDTALDPRWAYYMEQEIRSSPANIDEIIRYYFRDPAAADIETAFEERKDIASETADRVSALSGTADPAALASGFRELLADPAYRELASRLPRPKPGAAPFVSDERRLLDELAAAMPERAADLAMADSLFVWKKRRSILRYLVRLVDAIREAGKAGGRVYLLASGTSYHAALAGACFFDHLAGVPVYPCNPGAFRSMYLDCLGSGDLIVGITQSGETKDLVDVFLEARERRKDVGRIALVNNENSRIPQELCDFYLPILCGPEIAVAATKSFMNQLVILYILAASFSLPERAIVAKLEKARSLISEALKTSAPAIDEAAARLCMKPSMHILGTGLIGLAREGALKVREVVLNHTEGYDAAEFKHGPNTILGKNTVFGADDLGRLLDSYNALLATDPGAAGGKGRDILARRPELLESVFGDYPLVFVCPPDERDVRITISQIHTHKIRGADVILFAERNPELALAVEGKPEGVARYWSKYVELPASGDRDLFVFPAAAALQYFAFRMSVLKKAELDSLGVADHGVHPDAPKNVSKSITVD
ncbi:MAG: SIS domain-containing protein [Spirochaetes bacterium]|nr:SIS domain-containing protein [Spirochaetota bacterium]